MLQLRCQTCLLAIVQLAAISEMQASNELAPHFIKEPSDIYVKKGKPASLSCVVGGDPKPAVRWRRNGVALDLTGDSRRTIKPDGSLHFSPIVHSRDEKPDEGKYQCEALSRINNLDYRIVSKTALVIIAGLSSKVTVSPATLKVKFGGIARFECSVKHSVPEALIHWKKKGKPDDISTGGRFTLIPSGALQISNVEFEDQGNYDCIAENKVISRSHTSTNSGKIEVLADRGFPQPPRFVTQPVDTVAIAGSLVVLECAVNGRPKPKITWLHNGTPVVLENRYSIIGESNLKMERVSVSDAGVYICRAEGGGGRKETQAELAVHYPPVFTKEPRDIHAILKSNGRFECEADGIPKPQILWSKSGDMIENSDYRKVGDGFLLIEGLVFADRGVYQCIAKNSLGDIQETAELFVYRRGEPIPSTLPPPTTPEITTTGITTTETRQVPEKPGDVAAWPLSDSEIEVTWAPPNVSHGKILAYTIFYSLSGEDHGDVKMVNTSGNNLRKKITNLRPDTNYSFNVFAINKHGTGAISNNAVSKTYASSHVPGKPLNLVAEAESESTIRVTWKAPVHGSGSDFSYVIIYKEADSNSPEMKDFTKQQTRLLRDLKTYTKYTISVFAENLRGGKGVSSTVEATTMGGVPQGPPRDFVLKPDSSGTGLISTWKPPNQRKANGRITYYIIKFKKVESQQENETERIGAENLQYNIKGLIPSTRYQAKIAAGTESGLGEFTKDWVEASTNKTKCKENSPPGKPKITAVNAFSNMIVVKWKPPDDAGLICVTGYNLGWGELSPYKNSMKLDSDQEEYIIQGLKSKQNYVIMLSATNSHGPGEDQQTDARTLSESPEVVKGLQAFPLSPKVMQLTWKDTHASTSVPVIYHVYHSVHGQVMYCGNTTRKAIKCSGLKAYTNYTFYVRRNMEKSNATTSNYTDEDKPSSPVDLTGNPDEKNFTLLTLHWQLPLRPNGHILRYRIYYSNNKKSSDEGWTSVVVDGSRLTQNISGLVPGETYFFRMQAQTKKGWGPLSEVKEIITLSATPRGGTAGNSDNVSSAVPTGARANNKQPGVGEQLKNKTLWIVIAAVAGITLIAIIIISVILCKKRSGDDIQRKPPTYKSVIQANGSAKKKHKEEKPPDLWINHTDHLEMKPMESVNPAPDVTNTSSIPRNSEEMKPLNDSPIDHIALDHERNSFMNNGNETDPDDIEELPPPPVIDSKDEPYPEYIDTGNRTPTPPPSPVISPYRSPRPITPENVRYPVFPMTSTPRYLPRTGSCENALEVSEPRPPQRARSYDPDFTGPSPMVPVFPGRYPISSLPKPRSKPPVAPADDIQLPPVGYSRTRSPNGYWTPPPKYEDIFARRSPPSSPPRNQEAVVADLDKEIAGLEGLMRDLNEITAVDL